MKNLILSLILVLSLCSCAAQEPVYKPLPKGHTIGYIVELGETGAIINANGKSLIAKNIEVLDGSLEVDAEYDLVYEILDRRGKTVLINLLGAEYSSRENAKRRAKLMLLIK